MGYENFYNQPRMNNSYLYSQQPVGLKGRPVSSIDEAKVAQIDFDGSLFIFPDIANKKIYTKQIGPDGSVILNMYESKPIPEISANNFITREEFNEVVETLRQAIPKVQKEEKEPAKQVSPQTKTEFNF